MEWARRNPTIMAPRAPPFCRAVRGQRIGLSCYFASAFIDLDIRHMTNNGEPSPVVEPRPDERVADISLRALLQRIV